MTTPLAAGRRPRSLRREDAIAIAKTSNTIPAGIRLAPRTIVPQMGPSEREGQLVPALPPTSVLARLVTGRRHRRRRLHPIGHMPIALPKGLYHRDGRPGESQPQHRPEIEGVDHRVVAPVVVQQDMKRDAGVA